MAAPSFVNLRDLEAQARARLPASHYDYVAGGAADERTLAANEAAFLRWRLRPRVLRGVAARDLRTTVLGAEVAAPVLVAPTALHQLMHPEAELATARGAAAAGSLLVASTLASRPLEDIAAAAPGPKWFQLYAGPDRAATEALARRARHAGYAALVLTVDAPLPGRRERDIRHGLRLAPGALANVPPAPGAEDTFAARFGALVDPALTWDAVGWLRRASGLPVVVKGVVTAEDAALAVEHGCAGIVVSNHGGRQLDACVATLDALPEVVGAAAGRCEVYLDGGVRRGTDALVALALGARAVLVGRPVLWGLAAGGAEGVAAVLRHLGAELDLALAMCGVRRLAEVDRALLARA